MENYEKLYKEALERATKLAFTGNISAIAAGEIFPELKESEDERIRKAIIEALGRQAYSEHILNDWGVSYEDAIAWLEKQGKTSWRPDKEEMGVLYDLCYISGFSLTGEQDRKLTRLYQDLKRVFFNGASFENMYSVDTSKEFEKQGEQENLCDKCRKEQPSHSCQDITALERCALERQKERAPKIIIPKFHIGEYIKPTPYNEKHLIKSINEKGYVLDFDFVVPFKDEDVWELVEQKIITWSEDDENYYQNCLKAMRTYSGKDTPVSKWIESLKDRVQTQAKQEWSEEDENIRQDIISGLKAQIQSVYAHDEHGKAQMNNRIDWLQSLKPQNHWKPSEQNLKDLEWCADLVKDKMGVGFHRLQVFIDEIKTL